MMEYPAEIHEAMQDISVIVTKTEMYSSSTPEVADYIYYQYYYIAWLQYFWIYSILIVCIMLIALYLKIRKNK